MNVQSMTERFLLMAKPDVINEVAPLLDKARLGWATAQLGFIEVTRCYLEKELSKPATDNISSHEAGGQWRIAFPHLSVCDDQRIREQIARTMAARKNWTNRTFFHGFPDCAEVHHEIETFIYFQLPLFYARMPGWDIALESMDDLAHHIGNWIAGIPDWFDWRQRQFVSVWLGTRAVRNQPPFDYQEGNHFRFIDVLIAAYLGTGKSEYAELTEAYADRWCEHIEKLYESGDPIRCSILPENETFKELGFGGDNLSKNSYEVFYSAVSDNTAYDIASALLDIYRVSGKKRYLSASEMIFDQFIEHSEGARPSEMMKDGKWVPAYRVANRDIRAPSSWIVSCSFLARYALRHDLLTQQERYRDPIVEWAKTIDESRNRFDQMMANVLVAGHFYTGNTDWLARAYAMAIRAAAVTEGNDAYHQCSWNAGRQGVRFLMELLYQPLLCSPEWGTRGSIPMRGLTHETPAGTGIPNDTAFRCWRSGAHEIEAEAVNLGSCSVDWRINYLDQPEETDSSPREHTISMHVEPQERIIVPLAVNTGSPVTGCFAPRTDIL